MSLAVFSFIRFPQHLAAPGGTSGGWPLAELARQPVFIVAVAAAALGYGVMNLLLAATPIAMRQCRHPFESAALVLEWHVLGMFVPSFFTGHLIRRFGALPAMGVGVLLNFVFGVDAGRGRAMRMAKKLQCGCAWISTHFMLLNEMPHGNRYGRLLSL